MNPFPGKTTFRTLYFGGQKTMALVLKRFIAGSMWRRGCATTWVLFLALTLFAPAFVSSVLLVSAEGETTEEVVEEECLTDGLSEQKRRKASASIIHQNPSAHQMTGRYRSNSRMEAVRRGHRMSAQLLAPLLC